MSEQNNMKMIFIVHFIIVLFIVAFVPNLIDCYSCNDTESDSDDEFNTTARENSVEDIYVRFYHGPTFCNFSETRLNGWSSLIWSEDYSWRKPSVLYIHGFTEHPLKSSVKNVVSGYLKTGGYNVFFLDWSNMAGKPYPTNAVPNTKKVADATAEVLETMVEYDFPLHMIHIVGHSLGSHVAGMIGNHMKSNGKTLQRITGLDPAGPGFYDTRQMEASELKSGDAHFVDVIHTDAGRYGTKYRSGTVDFWPNGGSQQPGCPPTNSLEYCSHQRSWRFWVESLIIPKSFIASKSTSYNKFLKKSCHSNGHSNSTSQYPAYMGIDANENLEGDYYLTTNSESPYGQDGSVNCEENKDMF